MRYLKQSTAATFRVGPFVDSTDGVTAETALTLTQADFRLSKAGAAYASKADTTAGTHDENGWYTCVLNTTDTATLGTLDIAINETGALPVWEHCTVLAANVYDSLIGGGDVLDVSTTQFNGSAVTQSGGRPEVNTTHAAGTAWGSGAITAASIASDAITAAKVASDVSAEIADAVWDEDATAHQTTGTFGQAIGDPAANTATIYAAVVTNAAGTDVAADIIAMKADTAAILVDTGTTLDARIPAALVGGRMDSSVGAMAANTLTASALATDAVTEISAAVGTPTTIAEAVLEAEIAVADDVSAAGTPTVRRRLRQLWQDNVKR